MKKANSFFVIYLDCDSTKVSNLSANLNQEESPIANSAEHIDSETIQKMYKITDEELKLRNGLFNGVLNSIIVRKLR